MAGSGATERKEENGQSCCLCQSITACVKLYKHFLTDLRGDSYEPKGASPSISNHLFAMYHARVDDKDKRTILRSFQPTDSTCSSRCRLCEIKTIVIFVAVAVKVRNGVLVGTNDFNRAMLA